MSAMQIDQDKKNKAAINFPCFNCGSHYFISFQRFKIDNYKNLQNVKCQRCKHEWIQIWDMPQQLSTIHNLLYRKDIRKHQDEKNK